MIKYCIVWFFMTFKKLWHLLLWHLKSFTKRKKKKVETCSTKCSYIKCLKHCTGSLFIKGRIFCVEPNNSGAKVQYEAFSVPQSSLQKGDIEPELSKEKQLLLSTFHWTNYQKTESIETDSLIQSGVKTIYCFPIEAEK